MEMAVDVALLPSGTVMNELISLIRYDVDSPIVLDKSSCWPHVTLAMGVIAEAKIPEFAQVLRDFAGEATDVEIVAEQTRIYTADNGRILSEVTVKVTDTLTRLRTRVAEAVRPLFVEEPATVDMFYAPPAVEAISTKWVMQYGETFRPHITLGQGSVKKISKPIRFAPEKLVLCQLGNYCTCRRILT